MQKSTRVAKLRKIMQATTQRRKQRKQLTLRVIARQARRRRRNLEHELAYTS